MHPHFGQNIYLLKKIPTLMSLWLPPCGLQNTATEAIDLSTVDPKKLAKPRPETNHSISPAITL